VSFEIASATSRKGMRYSREYFGVVLYSVTATKETVMKVLMVITSHDQLGNTGRKTGFWLEELAAPYYV
jgi:hypothetical protein